MSGLHQSSPNHALRIAYVINSLEGGGAASPVPAIFKALEAQGATLRLLALTRRNGLALPPIEQAGIDVRIREGGTRDHLAALRWTVRQVRDFEATHIWTSLSRATLLGQLCGTMLQRPVISWQHNAYLKPWNERLLRWGRNRSDLWIADSSEVARLTRERLRVPAERLVTWPIFSANPDALQARAWQPGETLQLGSLGRLHPAKGYDILIDALAILRRNGFAPPVPFALRIAGDGPERDALLARASAAGVEPPALIGFQARPDAFLASCHLYLQPSRREGFCIAAHEAMQAGLPVLGTRTGEMPYTIEERISGRLVDPQDAQGLAQALADLMGAPAALGTMGEAARSRVLERFSQAHFRNVAAEIVATARAMKRGGDKH